MIRKFKKCIFIALFMLISLTFSSISVSANDDSVLNLGTRTITDVNKTWTITFNNDINFNSVLGNVQIKDITSDKNLYITPIQGESKSVVKVKAPSEGYVVGHNYQITISKNIKLVNGAFLSRTTALNFIVAPKGNSAYTVSASVVVSPLIDAFKQITIISTNIPNASKYKIEGNNNLFDIGKPMVSLVGGNTVKVYICDSVGSVLGTTNMDVSTSKSNMNLNLQ
ncbi:hypothetical protein [Clostridium drakei]|uniref:Hydrolase n=1 Tax=Clostridium drakei TaxID=332101 RepID=A0A2U8DLR9_9CLOT|nr:hypothetical protein [Clostridium drakei]AWI03700.1 hydrolase [Clostridium drakei]